MSLLNRMGNAYSVGSEIVVMSFYPDKIGEGTVSKVERVCQNPGFWETAIFLTGLMRRLVTYPVEYCIKLIEREKLKIE